MDRTTKYGIPRVRKMPPDIKKDNNYKLEFMKVARIGIDQASNFLNGILVLTGNSNEDDKRLDLSPKTVAYVYLISSLPGGLNDFFINGASINASGEKKNIKNISDDLKADIIRYYVYMKSLGYVLN